MAWEVAIDAEDRSEWLRDDRCATVRLRRTAGGRWAVTLDRLTQAPEGSAYARETVSSREAAVGLAEEWMAEHDIEAIRQE